MQNKQRIFVILFALVGILYIAKKPSFKHIHKEAHLDEEAIKKINNAPMKKAQEIAQRRLPASKAAPVKKDRKVSKKLAPFFPRKAQAQFKGMTPINTPDKNWKGALKKALFRFGFNPSNFNINHIESVMRKEGQGVRNLEWVKISYSQNGKPQSYDALIDSETGLITRSWNHVHYEPVKNKSNSKQLSFSVKGTFGDIEEQ